MDFAKFAESIRTAGREIWRENKSEGESLYFLDPDHHQLELHVGDWRSRLPHYRQRSDVPDMIFFAEP